MSILCFIVTKEENEERMMIDPTSREDPKVKELLQVRVLSHFHTDVSDIGSVYVFNDSGNK